MPSEIELLRTMDPEPDKPSGVDIQRAIATGRRRRALRGAGYAGVAAVTTLAVAGVAIAFRPGAAPAPVVAASQSVKATANAATPPAGCTLTQLPVPDDVPKALVSGADPTGKYIVGRSYPNGRYQPIIWADGKARNVSMPGDDEQQLQDVNSSGVAVGWSYVSSGGQKPVMLPYAYANGQVTRLKGVEHGAAYAINDAGAIAGDDDAGIPLVWPSPAADPIRLSLPAGARGAMVRGIDEDGTVVATVDNTHAYVWSPDGTPRELPLPTIGGKKATAAWVFGIRNGWVSGAAGIGQGPASGAKARASGEASAVRWNIRTGEVQVVEGIRMADETNAQGWAVGSDKQGRAVLVADGRTVALPPLTDGATGGNSTIASTLSDDGRIIGGQSDDAAGVIRAVVWHCK